MNYSKLEGKELDYQYNIFTDHKIKAIVDGVDPDIGISIFAKDNRNKHLICLHGPSAPEFSDLNITNEQYQQLFNAYIKQIKNGKITLECFYMLNYFKQKPKNFGGSLPSCPFS